MSEESMDVMANEKINVTPRYTERAKTIRPAVIKAGEEENKNR